MDQAKEREKEQNKRGSSQRFTVNQVDGLIKVFEQEPYPDQVVYAELAERLNLTIMQVVNWAKNYRRELRKLDPNRADLIRRYGPIRLSILRAAFEFNPKPERAVRRDLARRTNLTEFQVYSWFMTQRHKRDIRSKTCNNNNNHNNTNHQRPSMVPYTRFTRHQTEELRQALAANVDQRRHSESSLAELATRIGLTRARVTRWFARQRFLQNFEAIGQALDRQQEFISGRPV